MCNSEEKEILRNNPYSLAGKRNTNISRTPDLAASIPALKGYLDAEKSILVTVGIKFT